MKSILRTYQLNRDVKPIFSQIDSFDWYDGVITGIGKLDHYDEYYLINLVAWDMISNIRVYTILHLTSNWVDKFKKYIEKGINITPLLNDFYAQYNGEAYLLKSKYLDQSNYEIAKLKHHKLSFDNTIEDIANQSDKDRNKWFELFENKT